MTATQVFNRFIKDYEYYWLSNLVKDIYYNRVVNEFNHGQKKNYNSLKKHFGDDKGLIVDCLLKFYGGSLQGFICDLYYREYYYIFCNKKYKNINHTMFDKLRSDFQIFLKENVKSGYRKYFIKDNMVEFGYDYGKGYYFVDFEYKDGKNNSNKHKE